MNNAESDAELPRANVCAAPFLLRRSRPVGDADEKPSGPVVEPPAQSSLPAFAAPINVRSASLAVLAVLGVIGFLLVARSVFIPVTIALVLSYALRPIVDWLQRTARLPPVLGAGVTLALILIVLSVGLEFVYPETMRVLDLVPRATAKFNAAMRLAALEPPGTVAKIKKAATEIEKAANTAVATSPASDASAAPAIRLPDASTFKMRDYLLLGTASAIEGVGQMVIIVALVYFLLIAGDSFRRTLVRVTGDTLSKKKITLQILDEIGSQIQRYLLVQLATSVLLAVATWVLFVWLGLENALFWACLGGVLHLVPYAGPTAFVSIIALVAFVQFDSLQPVFLVTACTLAIVGVIGLLLVPWLTEKVGKLKAVTVFITLLFWGWLWGAWGLLLGVPIVMAINAVCARAEDLQPISEFLGHAPRQAANGACHPSTT
jgi:predicted PurR-regulated permease PerM